MSERAPLPPIGANVPYHLVDGFFSNWPMRERWLLYAGGGPRRGDRDHIGRKIADMAVGADRLDRLHRADEVFFAAMLKAAGDVRDQAAREAEKAGQRELANTIREIPLPEWLGRGVSAPVAPAIAPELEPASEPWPTSG